MNPDIRTRLLALFAVLFFVTLTGLYVLEFPVLSNTLGVGWLVAGSLTVAVLLAAFVLWRWQERFKPWERHLPEVLLIALFFPVFAPLAGSLLNRSIGQTQYQSFEFIAERPYFSSNYGLLKGEKPQTTGYFLTVRENGHTRQFRYKKQVYFPLSKPGDDILLPVKKGLFGFRVVLLK